MTVFFNVTDAISASSHHGITRTERQLAAALATRPGVEFVFLADGLLRRVEHGDVVERLHPDEDEGDAFPVIERFGIDRPPAQRRGAHVSFRRVAAARSSRRHAGRPAGVTPKVAPGDALVSVGLDWIHEVLDEAERWAFGKEARYVGFCYDLIPIDHPEWLFPPDPVRFEQHFQRVTRVASSVLCISDHTRSDFDRHFPDYGAERVKVLRLGADAAVATRPEHDRFAESLFDGEPYAVYCATIDRRKNHQLLYRAAKEMARRGMAGNIAFVGKFGSGVDDLIDSLRHDPLVAGRIAHVGNCDDYYLAAIYKRARFAVYPSLYEGWGLGVTEALAHGTPCIVATGSSLGEAGLGTCLELHPLRTSEWAEAMTRYFGEPPVLPAIHIPTWEEAADSLLELVAV
jgi:glycosyltransferase involved in cell wall biosynthesis